MLALAGEATMDPSLDVFVPVARLDEEIAKTRELQARARRKFVKVDEAI